MLLAVVLCGYGASRLDNRRWKKNPETCVAETLTDSSGVVEEIE